MLMQIAASIYTLNAEERPSPDLQMINQLPSFCHYYFAQACLIL